MIDILLDSKLIRLDDLFAMTEDCFLAAFIGAKVTYSQGNLCDVVLDEASIFGLRDCIVGLTFLNGSVIAVSISRQHEHQKHFSRRNILKSTIKSISKVLKKWSIYNIFTGERSWRVGHFILTYRFYEHFLYEENIIIKHK